MDIYDDKLKAQYYLHIDDKGSKQKYPRWRNNALVVKYPSDMVLYAQAIFKNKPDWIVETGTWFGGSTCFLADMLFLIGGKGVISIDRFGRHKPPHPLVEYVTANSVSLDMFRGIRRKLRLDGGKVMVSLDSSHKTPHVARELELYSQVVTQGQYLVVEDCWSKRVTPYMPYEAVQNFLKERDDFELHEPEKQFIFAVTRGGWLWKK